MRATANKKSQRKIIYEGQFLRFISCGDWEFVERNNCSAIAIIVALTKDQDILFVEQYRAPVDRKVIEFPAGLANDHKSSQKESVVTAAKRELEEETGYRAGKMVKLLEGPVSSGSSADMVTMFFANNVKKVSDGGGDCFESIRVHKIPLSGAGHWLEKMKRKGCLIEPKIYTGLYFLKTYNRKLLEGKGSE